MRLWSGSDLHIELTCGWDLPARAARREFDVMIVSADLISRTVRGAKWLLRRLASCGSLAFSSASARSGYGAGGDDARLIRSHRGRLRFATRRPSTIAWSRS
jgi:hypothetical protein